MTPAKRCEKFGFVMTHDQNTTRKIGHIYVAHSCRENKTSDRRGNHVSDDENTTITKRQIDVVCLLGYVTNIDFPTIVIWMNPLSL